MLVYFNFSLALMGLIGWFYVWRSDKYFTGRTIRIQCGFMTFGVMWLLLILADTVQNFEPTGGTILARLIILIGMWLLKPLLNKRGPL